MASAAPRAAPPYLLVVRSTSRAPEQHLCKRGLWKPAGPAAYVANARAAATAARSAATLAAYLTADEHVPQLLPSVLFCAVVDSEVVATGVTTEPWVSAAIDADVHALRPALCIAASVTAELLAAVCTADTRLVAFAVATVNATLTPVA